MAKPIFLAGIFAGEARSEVFSPPWMIGRRIGLRPRGPLAAGADNLAQKLNHVGTLMRRQCAPTTHQLHPLVDAAGVVGKQMPTKLLFQPGRDNRIAPFMHRVAYFVTQCVFESFAMAEFLLTDADGVVAVN